MNGVKANMTPFIVKTGCLFVLTTALRFKMLFFQRKITSKVIIIMSYPENIYVNI